MGGVYFLFGDGSVRYVDYETDLDILVAILTPDGRERVAPP
jgi:prepilin-type processing-associated H-X9-DG protein